MKVDLSQHELMVLLNYVEAKPFPSDVKLDWAQRATIPARCVHGTQQRFAG